MLLLIKMTESFSESLSDFGEGNDLLSETCSHPHLSHEIEDALKKVNDAVVAQLVEAPDRESGGWEFESLRRHHHHSSDFGSKRGSHELRLALVVQW